MNAAEITSSLNKLFNSGSPNNRIIFWDDEGGEFQDILDDLALENVNVIRLDQTPALELKIKLDLEDVTGRYLLYSPEKPVKPEKDWLLGLRSHSGLFDADFAAMAVRELGLHELSLRDHLRNRRSFLKNKARFDSLKKLIDPNDSETAIDRKMIGVLVASQPDIFDILIKIVQDTSFIDNGLDDQYSKSWIEIQKYDLGSTLQKFIEEKFCYAKATFKLRELLVSLFVTDFVDSIKFETPTGLAHLEIQAKGGRNNATVFLSQWRNDISSYKSYDRISRQLAQDLHIDKLIDKLDQDSLSTSMTFELVEQRLLRLLRDELINNVSTKPDDLRKFARRRREGHWANPNLQYGDDPENPYSLAYDALETAAELLFMRRTGGSAITFKSLESAYKEYTSKYFRIDQLYRHYHEATDKIEKIGWDLLKDLGSSIEDCYSHWYLDQSAVAWGSFMKEKTEGFLAKWTLPGIFNQYAFFEHYVKPQLPSGSKTRVYVIISDAFRYEAAEELTKNLNTKYRFSATLESMLGVVPSYTALGMAALAPHKGLSFKPDSADYLLVDGQSFSTLDERSAALGKSEGIAVKADTLSSMSKDQGREFVKKHRLIYIYHNTIDAAGDSASSESMTFEAVRKAINEISNLVKQIINNFNGNHIFITSDHGFLYQESHVGHHAKTDIQVKPEHALRSKKRYILGSKLGTAKEVWTGNTSITASTNPGLDFWIPKGRNLFHFAGGSRFIHGGVMPQEIVIPVVHVKAVKGEGAKNTVIKKVGVALLTSIQKLVTNSQKLELIQTDPVSDRYKPSVVKISLRDGDKLISNELTLTFDSTSDKLDDRKRSAVIRVVSGDYDLKREYFIVIRDENEIEITRHPVRIDISFTDDFS